MSASGYPNAKRLIQRSIRCRSWAKRSWNTSSRAAPKPTIGMFSSDPMAPVVPLTYVSISNTASHYLRKAGIAVSRPGSHTLRHTCVQRLVDADFSFKLIGDYVGHRSPASTQIYGKVAVEALREVALGDIEEVLR
jgi:integrase